MQPAVTDRPYEFVPPHHGNFWPFLLKLLVPRYCREKFGVTDVEYRNTDRLRELISAGHGILLAPNHCRMADPAVMQLLSKHLGQHFFTMASAHLFYGSKLQAWVIRRGGAFSIYREGVDRQAVKEAIDILAAARRPLVVFPEGFLTHSNDRLTALMAGVSLMARSAHKQRAREVEGGRVLVVPVAIKYLFGGDVEAEVIPMIEEMERRLAWRPQRDLPLFDRIFKLGSALLAVKEMEFQGEPGQGDVHDRLDRLIDHLLVPMEEHWLEGAQDDDVIERVKSLRKAILPDMIEGKLTDEDFAARSRQLEDMFLAQQLSLFPPGYVSSRPTVDRIIETVDKFHEGLTEVEVPHAPTRCVIQIGEPIDAGVDKKPGKGDPILGALETTLGSMLEALASESRLYSP